MPLLRGSIPESGLNPSEPPGWYLENGQYLPRPDTLKYGVVRHSNNLETITGNIIDEICALNFDILDCRGNSRTGCQNRK